jgi:hypothetical protein
MEYTADSGEDVDLLSEDVTEDSGDGDVSLKRMSRRFKAL